MSSRPLRQLHDIDVHVARRILRSLHERGGEVARLVEEALARFYGGDDPEIIADEVFDELCLLRGEDLWDRSGPRHDGAYVEPGEAAYEMVRETVAPYVARIEDHLEEDRTEAADGCVRGIGLGIHRFSREADGQFREWAVDAPAMMFEEVLVRWRAGRPDAGARRDMAAWRAEHLSEW